jgi:hypothetical protein
LGQDESELALDLPPTAQGQDGALTAGGEGGHVVGTDHAAIGHQHRVLEPEAAPQLLGHRLPGGHLGDAIEDAA